MSTYNFLQLPEQYLKQRKASIPTASIIGAAWSRDGVLVALVDCPLCAKTHSHGWPEFPDAPGLRSSHCRSGSRPYLVTVPDGLRVPLPLKRGEKKHRYRVAPYFDGIDA